MSSLIWLWPAWRFHMVSVITAMMITGSCNDVLHDGAKAITWTKVDYHQGLVAFTGEANFKGNVQDINC